MNIEKVARKNREIDNVEKGVVSSANTKHGNRKFDAEKVARIKAQLASGDYEISPERIVSKMVGRSI